MWSNMRQKLKLLSEPKIENSLNSSTDSAYYSSPDYRPKREPFKPSLRPNGGHKVEVIGLKGKSFHMDTRNAQSSVPWLSGDIGDALRRLEDKQNDRQRNDRQPDGKQVSNKRIRRYGPRPQHLAQNDGVFRQNYSLNYQKIPLIKETSIEKKATTFRMRANSSTNINETKHSFVKIVNQQINEKAVQQKEQKEYEEYMKEKEDTDPNVGTGGSNHTITRSKSNTQTFFVPKISNGMISTKGTIKRVVTFNDSSDSDPE